MERNHGKTTGLNFLFNQEMDLKNRHGSTMTTLLDISMMEELLMLAGGSLTQEQIVTLCQTCMIEKDRCLAWLNHNY